MAESRSHELQIQPRFGNRSRALIVDAHATARSLLGSQLRGLGVGQVLYSATAHDARKHLENLGVDVLLVEYQLSAQVQGQALIDEWRRDGLLSLRTVVVMLSTQASYEVVAQVAESALDGFIIKPFTPGMLEDRLMAAFQRKDAMREIYDAIESEQHPLALTLCEALFKQRAPYWTSAARIGAELALRLDQLALADAMFAAVLADKAVPWAKLGLARVLQAGGDTSQAVSTIQNLLADEPTYADAYDVMGRIHAEQGNMAGAIEAYRQAAEITPHSVVRAQKYGILAWYAAEPDVALAALENAARIGGDSPHFDHQALLLLAMARFQNGDTSGLDQCHKQLAGALARRPVAASQASDAGDLRHDRLRRMAQMAQALVAVQARDRPLLQDCLVPVADDVLAPGFDVEAATNLLTLLATSEAASLAPQHAGDWVRLASLRFCVSKQVTEMLAKACGAAPLLEQQVRTAHAEINEVSRTALSEGLAGRHQLAVEALLQAVERTRNAKLLELAQAALDRHRANIAAAEALAERCGILRALCSTAGRSHLLVNDSGGRPAGGVELPVRSAWRRDAQAAPA